ncbi:MAG: hypothetical protein JW909_04710 [Planctomycetes bacterium]|nr:hypothetical protein [Planctomycetota bacterium]
MHEKPAGPSAWYFLLAGAVVLTGTVMAGLQIGGAISDFDDSIQTMVVPGISRLELDKPGTYTVFHEFHSFRDGRHFDTEGRIRDLMIEVKSVETGQPLPLYHPAGTSTYSIGGRQGASMLAFAVTEPGTYDVRGFYPQGREGPEAVISVASGAVLILMMGIVKAMGFGFGGVLLGGMTALLVFLKRRAAGKPLQEPAAGNGLTP